MNASNQDTILKVALPVPLMREFDYLLPQDLPLDGSPIGRRVVVPFGVRKKLTGIVIDIADHTEANREKLRNIQCFLDDFPVMDTEILTLCQWCAHYYLHGIGEVLQLALPTLLRKPMQPPTKRQRYWQLTSDGKKQQANNFGRARKQYQAWELLRKQPQDEAAMSNAELTSYGVSPTIINNLARKGLIEAIDVERPIDIDLKAVTNEPESPLVLNQEQQNALEAINFSTFGCYLLEGITGSGKTEVYLQVIDKVIAESRQVLMLVPEIGLTPQTLERFQRRFAIPIALMHSGLTDTQRYLTWKAAKDQQAMLIIGTRSSIFCPLPRLGLIIVDEEHDGSYKQQEGVRYSARDVAVVRAKKSDVPLILGSATPSLETLHNALHGRYHHLLLNQRATGAELAGITCIETKESGLAKETLTAIHRCINDNQQVLVFVNRRGYAPTLLCLDCGWISQCRRCDSNMTLHSHPRHLHCHHCDWQATVPQQCAFCHSVRLEPIGQGTQRSEEQLVEQFPQIPVLRIDSDTARRKSTMQETIATINHNNACILVGTQMLAKGHHFPKVTLVVVLGIDSSFFSGDFRGAERMGQLLIQVSGRAGREKYPGRVLFQTQFGDHPLLRILINEGYPPFARQLLQDRKSAAMPPYHSMAAIRCHAQQPDPAINFLKEAHSLARKIYAPDSKVRYVGPTPALLEKRNNRYHYILQIITASRPDRDRLLVQLYGKLEKLKRPKGLRWTIDVDPYEY